MLRLCSILPLRSSFSSDYSRPGDGISRFALQESVAQMKTLHFSKLKQTVRCVFCSSTRSHPLRWQSTWASATLWIPSLPPSTKCWPSRIPSSCCRSAPPSLAHRRRTDLLCAMELDHPFPIQWRKIWASTESKFRIRNSQDPDLDQLRPKLKNLEIPIRNLLIPTLGLPTIQGLVADENTFACWDCRYFRTDDIVVQCVIAEAHAHIPCAIGSFQPQTTTLMCSSPRSSAVEQGHSIVAPRQSTEQ